jgi:hypothetical protein
MHSLFHGNEKNPPVKNAAEAGNEWGGFPLVLPEIRPDCLVIHRNDVFF